MNSRETIYIWGLLYSDRLLIRFEFSLEKGIFLITVLRASWVGVMGKGVEGSWGG